MLLLESRAKTKVANANAIVAAAVKSLGDAIRVPTTKTIAIAQIISSLGCKFIFFSSSPEPPPAFSPGPLPARRVVERAGSSPIAG